MQSLSEIKSRKDFLERYLPSKAKAEEAIKMTKRQFWPWFMELSEDDRDKVRKEMVAEAQRLEHKARHIYHLLYD